jgi:hypothetical protein
VNKTEIVNVTNHLDAMEEAQKSLDLLFKDFPACLMTVEAIGQPKVDQSQNATEDIIPMIQEVRISINYQKYEQMMNKLTVLFDSLGYKKGKKISLTEENCEAFTKENFNNCLCIITRKDPNLTPMKIQDMNGVIYRLPGQIMRYMGEYAGRLVVLQYELTDIDNNVLANQEIYNRPNISVLGFQSRFVFSKFVEGATTKDYLYTKALRRYFEKVNDKKVGSPLTGLLLPLFCLDWYKTANEAYKTANEAKHMTRSPFNKDDKIDKQQLFLKIDVNRHLYKNAQKLKINVSIHNEEDDKLDAP